MYKKIETGALSWQRLSIQRISFYVTFLAFFKICILYVYMILIMQYIFATNVRR